MLAPVLGFVSLTALLVAQLQTLGTTSYYFLKYLLGFELILAAFIPAVVGMLLAEITVAAPATKMRRAAWSLVAALVATQCFGHLALQDSLLFSETDDGTAAIAPPYSRAGIARGIIAATSATSPGESFDREYVPCSAGRALQSFYPDGWFHAVNASLSGTVSKRVDLLRKQADSVTEIAELTRQVLATGPTVEVVVDPGCVAGIQGELGDTRLASRVVPWSGTPSQLSQSRPRENADSRSWRE